MGGYSIELSPGMYNDPDFAAKLLMVGVRYFRGLGNSHVYHFETKTTTRIKKKKHNHCFYKDLVIFLRFIFVFTIFIYTFAVGIHTTLITCGQNSVIQPY